MTREHLETLTREELIDLILQLQTAVTEVKAKVAELEAQLAGKKPPPKTSSNSSVPPSSQRKGNNRSTRRKKRGAKHGHVGKGRVRVEPDVFIECKLATCPDCGADLQDVEQKVVGSSQGVPCDNNASERALRNSVIHRKVSGGFRSDAGAEAHAVVSSVVDTARKHWSSDAIAKGQSGEDVFETLQGHIGSPAPVFSSQSATRHPAPVGV